MGAWYAGPPNSGTPVMSTHKYQRQGGFARPSPMSTTTLGPRIHDPSVFTVTDRRVSTNLVNPYTSLMRPPTASIPNKCCTLTSKPCQELTWLVLGGC